jgi:hypothetical protein
MGYTVWTVTFFYTGVNGREQATHMQFTGLNGDIATKKALRYCKKSIPYVIYHMTGWAVSLRSATPMHIMPHFWGTVMDLII